MALARSFRDLRVYRESFRLAMVIFQRSGGFPDDERYGLISQVRRSSRSVCANIAEAWRRRRYPAAFVAKLVDAEAEASETRVHLEIACACGYMSVDVALKLDFDYDRLVRQLARMRSRPERWTPRGRPPGASRPRTARPSPPPSPPPSSDRQEANGHSERSSAGDVRSGRSREARSPVGPGGRRDVPSSTEAAATPTRRPAR